MDTKHSINCIRTVSSIIMLPFLTPPSGEDEHKAAQCRSIFYVLFLAAHIKQLGYGFIVIVYAAYPFEQDKVCEYKSCSDYGQVIAYSVEFLSKFQKQFAGFKTAFEYTSMRQNGKISNAAPCNWTICVIY